MYTIKGKPCNDFYRKALYTDFYCYFINDENTKDANTKTDLTDYINDYANINGKDYDDYNRIYAILSNMILNTNYTEE